MASLVLSGDTSGSITVAAPSVSGSNTQTLAAVTGTLAPVVSGTAVTASGTAVNFTGIPSWAKRITVMFSAVSTNGTSLIQIQLGDSGGVETTAYASSAWTANTNNANSSTGFIIHASNASAARSWDGAYTLVLLDTNNNWVVTGTCISFNDNAQSIGAGRKQVSDTLTQIRITTVNGTDTFDAGTINILYE